MLKLVVDNTVTEPEPEPEPKTKTDSTFSNFFTCKDCVYYLSKSDSCSLQLALIQIIPISLMNVGTLKKPMKLERKIH